MPNAFRITVLAAIAAVASWTQAGCAAEDPICDEAGCWVCDGLGCREVDLATACTAAADCPEGYLCSAGACRPPEDLCRFDYQCGSGRACIDGRCLQGCNESDRPCPTGQRCEAGRCVEPPAGGSCRADEDCGEGLVCRAGVCQEGCRRDAECPDGQICYAGACELDDRPRPFCSSDADCRTGHVCVEGVCRTPCVIDDDCARFDAQFNICLDGYCVTSNEVTSDCRVSADCADGRVCRDGVCRASG